MGGDPRLRRAHVALALTFVAFGTIDGTWAARLPALKAGLSLDSAQLGLVVFAVSATATAVLPLAGWLAARFGGRGPVALGLGLAAAALAGAAFAPRTGELAAAAAFLGGGFGIVDVAANAHGIALERRLGRHILSALHGMWSVGLLAGSAVAAALAAVAVGVHGNFPAVAAGAVVLALVAVPRLLPHDGDGAPARFALPRGQVALPALLMFCSMFLESSAMNWSAVFLAGPAHADAAVAAAGVVAFAVAMALSRFAGDRLLARWRVAGLARRGGVVSAVGVALALASRTPAAGLAGFALVGVGCAALVPALFRVAGSVAGTDPAAGIAAVATAGYTGSVVNGPAIGFLARGVGLTPALGLLGAAALVIALLGPRLVPRLRPVKRLPPWVDPWCRSALGAKPVEVLFCISHLSEVVGVRLADGREVVVKRRADGTGRTSTCVTAQRLLAEGGFPCPLPLTEAIVREGVAVHAERFVGDGEPDVEDTPAAAARSATLLADLVRRLTAFDLDPPLPNPEWVKWDAIPPRPAAASVPAWIEETTRRVQEKLAGCRLPCVLGHADWEAQNIRWRDGEPYAVHDWDSLAWLPEPALVGTAAGVFASHGEPTLAPIRSSAAFLEAYEGARGVDFSAYATEIAWAASIWVALHNARDELIFDRPRLSFERLGAQRVERLIRAGLI